MPEYKALPQFTMGIEDRTVTGIGAVHGNVDNGLDRSHPGLFGDGTVKGRKRVVFLWQHDSSAPPIATIDRVFEVAGADLPPAVKLYAPDATGGVAVQRTYLDTARGNEVLAGLKAAAISEMSYAYDPTRFDYEELDDGRTIRNIYTADLFDFSDVNWGLNPATSATGQKGLPLHLEHDTVLAAVRGYIKRLEDLASLRAKEGRVLSGENRKRIESAIDALDGARTALDDLLSATELRNDAPKAAPDYRDDRALFQEWQRVRQRAALIGVSNS